jgi:beta-lactamase regulating signal transducer with metallopeptidase domain
MWHFISEHADTLLNVGLELLLKSTALLTLAFAITLAARKSSAAAKHMLWTAIMCMLLALPVVIAVAPQWRIIPRWPSANPLLRPKPAAIIPAVINPLLAISEPQQPTIHSTLSTPALTPSPTPATAQSQTFLWQPWAIALWLLGTLLTLSPMLLALAWFHRLQRTARPLPDWTSLLADTRRRLNTHRPITLLETPRIRMPMTVGTLHPRILLPPEAATWPDPKRRLVLLHETAHILRLDVLTHTLANLARALYWPHPLVWLAHRQMTLEAERAADDRVLLATHESATYARTLIEVAAGLNPKHTFIGGLAMARKSTLETRIRSVLHDRANRRGISTLHILTAALLAAAIGLPLGMLRAARANDPATAQPAAASVDASTVKHFSSGETIELLGITHNPNTGPWWRPDGAPMIPPAATIGGRQWQNDNVFILKITAGSEGSQPVADINGETELKSLEKMFGPSQDTYYSISQDRQLPTLRIGTGKGDWKTDIETHWGESSKSDNGQIALGQPRTWQNGPGGMQTGVLIAYTFDPRKVEWRLAAIDKDGKEHYAVRPNQAASLPPIRQEELYFPNLAPDQVQSLRFETRPREWVQFEGMVTNPEAPTAQNPAATAEGQALIRTLQAQRAAELAYAKAQKETSEPAKPAPTPAQPGNYYIIGGSRPGIYQLGPQSLTVLQAVVSSGVTQSDLSVIRIEVVRQKDGKSEMPVNTTLDKLLHDDVVKIQSGDVVRIKDLTELRQKEAELQTKMDDLSDFLPRATDPNSQKDMRAKISQTQAKFDELKAQEMEP